MRVVYVYIRTENAASYCLFNARRVYVYIYLYYTCDSLACMMPQYRRAFICRRAPIGLATIIRSATDLVLQPRGPAPKLFAFRRKGTLRRRRRRRENAIRIIIIITTRFSDRLSRINFEGTIKFDTRALNMFSD